MEKIIKFDTLIFMRFSFVYQLIVLKMEKNYVDGIVTLTHNLIFIWL